MNSIAESCGAGDAGRPLVAGVLRGYRTWRIPARATRVPSGSLPLTALTRPHIMWPSTLVAECRRGDDGIVGRPVSLCAHRAPERACQCGIYGWYRPGDVSAMNSSVFGVIEASGVVIMGTRGFRAERARVVAVATRSRRVAERCAEQHIAVYRHRADLVRDYPPDSLTGLLGEDALRAPITPAHYCDRQPAVYAAAGSFLAISVAMGLSVSVAMAVLIVIALAPWLVLVFRRLR